MLAYLQLLTVFFFIPLCIFWIFFWKVLLRYRKIFLFTVIPTYFFGVPWDLLSVRTGPWLYNSSPTLGIWFFGGPSTGLPFEELVLFTFFCPFFITTVSIIAWDIYKKYVR
ncbi:MAG TPA: hypothetical protein VLB73_02065 [Patescibacteria group bacterium]|nr:hypothetical protein [Patescibacteria group bacterium]